MLSRLSRKSTRLSSLGLVVHVVTIFLLFAVVLNVFPYVLKTTIFSNKSKTGPVNIWTATKWHWQ